MGLRVEAGNDWLLRQTLHIRFGGTRFWGTRLGILTLTKIDKQIDQQNQTIIDQKINHKPTAN